MSDFREEVAGRLERAADRMYNSGFLDEERRYRDAAADIRAGLSLEGTQALERQLLTGREPGFRNRLTALAAQGEYDGPGGDDSSAAGSAVGDALDEPDLTEMESGASQLLSTAASTGLSDPYGSAQGGWVSSAQSVDPYTAVGAGDDGSSAFTGGQSVDPYTDAVPEDDNPNSFTDSQNVDPLTGSQNSESYTGGDASTQSPPPTASGWAAFGYSGPPQSMLSSPDLLAQNDATPTNTASDATSGAGSITLNGQQWGWSDFVSLGGVTYNRFDSPDGLTIALQPSGGGPIVLVSASDGSVLGAYSPSGDFVPAPVAIERPAPGTPPPADFVPEPGQPTPATTPVTPPSTPTPDPQPSPDPTQTQPSGQPDPSTASPPPSTAPETPTVPFNPQADSPFASWLLYGSDTPVLDFLTNDSNLQVAQNVAAGVAIGAATIATGGLLLEAAPGALAAFGGAQSISAAAAPLAAGAAGVVATNPNLPEEIEEELQGTLPALGPQLDNALQAVEEEAPSLAEQANTRFQDQVQAARQFFAEDLSRVLDYGGSSRLSGGLPVPVSPSQLGYASGNLPFARVLTGNAMEARVFEQILTDPQDYQLFDQLSGAGRIDFVGTGEFEGFTFELTTEGGVAAHSLREYLQQPGAFIFTYPPLL